MTKCPTRISSGLESWAMQMPCHGCRHPERGLHLLEIFFQDLRSWDVSSFQACSFFSSCEWLGPTTLSCRRWLHSSILSLSSLEVQLIIFVHAQTNISKRRGLGVGCCYTAVNLQYRTCFMFLSLAAFTVTAFFFVCVFVKWYRGIL